MSTLLLNHFNGTDGATTFTDEVPGITWGTLPVAPDADPELDTGFKKFGTAALRFPGLGVFQALYGSGFTSPYTGSWSAEAFGARASGATGGSVLEISLQNSSNVDFATFGFYADTSQWYFQVNDSSSALVNQSGALSYSAGTFYHLAIQRNDAAGTWDAYFNGVRLVSASAGDCGAFTRIRLAWDSGVVDAWFDSVRITNEVLYSGSTYTVPSTEFTLGPTVNVETFAAEFGREVDTPIRSSNIVVQSSEYDFEADEVAIRLTQSDPQSQYVWEGGSPAIAHTHIVSVDSLETGWEISLQQDVAPGAMEYEWEAGSVGIPIDSFIGANDTPLERDWAAGSPSLYSKNFLRGVTPRRRRIIAGRRTAVRRLEPIAVVEVTANRRTAVERVLR